jgi:hypothetical protein
MDFFSKAKLIILGCGLKGMFLAASVTSLKFLSAYFSKDKNYPKHNFSAL